MLELIFIIWIISRILRPRCGCRHHYRRPFFGLGWGLPLLFLYLTRRRDPPADHGDRGFGPDGFGQPHDGSHGFGGSGGWW